MKQIRTLYAAITAAIIALGVISVSAFSGTPPATQATAFEAALTTTDETTNVICEYVPPISNGVVRVEVVFTAAGVTSSASYGRIITASVVQGQLYQVGPTASIGVQEDDGKYEALLRVGSSNTIVASVAGNTNRVVKWACWGKAYYVSTN